VAEQSDAAKARVRLWLRSERAMGLKSVPLQIGNAPPIEPPTPREPAAPARRRADGPAPSMQTAFFPTPGSQPNLMPPPTDAPLALPVLSSEEKRSRLAAMDDKEVRGCTRCRLCETRTHTVFGEGDVDASIMFIGEGPGENEDKSGRPFVGRAGDMLNKWIAAMGLKREQVFIANIVKCRPPGNREPAPDEVATCTPYLQRQLEIIRPRVIVTLGRPAAQHMLQQKVAMGKIRGQWQNWRGIQLMPTFHPAYVLRQYTPQTRAAVWSDLQEVMRRLGLPLPKKSSST
jgi:DNA polymerase